MTGAECTNLYLSMISLYALKWWCLRDNHVIALVAQYNVSCHCQQCFENVNVSQQKKHDFFQIFTSG